MKLLYSPTSPYVRKVRVLIRELELQTDIEEIKSIPFDKEQKLISANPLGKVPALILADGTGLYDSRVISEYLISSANNTTLFPIDERRWPVLCAQALAEGVMDVAVATVMERMRDTDEQSPAAIQNWQQQICSSIGVMPDHLAKIEGPLNIGHISIAVALSYLDFRHNELQWRVQVAPSLVQWHAEIMQRPSMLETEPSVKMMAH